MTAAAGRAQGGRRRLGEGDEAAQLTGEERAAARPDHLQAGRPVRLAAVEHVHAQNVGRIVDVRRISRIAGGERRRGA